MLLQSVNPFFQINVNLAYIMPYVRKNLHQSNQRPKCPLGEKDRGLTVCSVLLSQLGKPAKKKRQSELLLAWIRRKGKMDFVIKILELPGLCLTPYLPLPAVCLSLDKFLNLTEPQFFLL